MEKLNFSININAPKEKVWSTLWNDATYRQWTSAFAEGSYAETDNWKEGTKVRFLSPSGEGMVSKVAVNKPNEYMSFEHQGVVKKGGIEDTTSDEVKQWAGAHENYTLEETGGKTMLKVDMDITEDFRDYFEKTWPKALERLKQISENN
jgi:hypothetical protein